MLYIVVFRTRLFEFPKVRGFLILRFVSITLLSQFIYARLSAKEQTRVYRNAFFIM